MIKTDGRVSFNRNALNRHIASLPDGHYRISVLRGKRTRRQNAQMWVWLDLMARCFANEFGCTKDDIHGYYKDKFLAKTIDIGGREIRSQRSTTSLTTREMSDYLDRIRADAASEWGITLPDWRDAESTLILQSELSDII